MDASPGARLGFVGVLPPPVNGMTLATEHLLQAVGERGPLRTYAIRAHPDASSGLAWRWRKFLRSLGAALPLLRWRTQGITTLYLVANSGWGLLLNVYHATIARALGYRVVLHHHVYAYVDRQDWRMRVLVAMLGPNTTHVTLCPEMERAFQRRYHSRRHVILPPNPAGGIPPRRNRMPWSGDGRFHLGHLSNLTVAKGFLVVLATLDALVARGLDVGLTLAGPVNGTAEGEALAEARTRHGDRIDYLGPLYGDDLGRFWDRADAMVFPTLYRNEAFPLVLVEALEAGCPAITFGRGCIPGLVAEGGVVLAPAADFVAAASDAVAEWIRDPPGYQRARAFAATRGKALRSDAVRQVELFLDELSLSD